MTAAWVAAARSMGAHLPPEARLADDPYGLRFGRLTSPPPRAAALAVRWFLPMRVWVMYMQVRTRILDDVMLAFVRRGGRQIVLLGAGYDCRALRFADALGGARVFEVDHPATQRNKRRVVGDPANVTYLSWHFEEQPMSALPAALAAAGHQATEPTLTIWEGVTMYLTPDAIDASVRAVRAYSSRGSELALTYFTRDLIDRPDPIRRLMAAVVRRGGEPFRFGWDPAELGTFFDARGFALAKDVSIADEAERMLPRAWSRGVGRTGGQRVALVRAAAESIAVATTR